MKLLSLFGIEWNPNFSKVRKYLCLDTASQRHEISTKNVIKAAYLIAVQKCQGLVLVCRNFPSFSNTIESRLSAGLMGTVFKILNIRTVSPTKSKYF